MGKFRILVINPGSTSTKIALFEDKEQAFRKSIPHSREELASYNKIVDQYEFRKDVILKTLQEMDVDIKTLSCVVGRGGLLRSIPSGTYKVNKQMLEDLRVGLQGEHASNLGGILAHSIAEPLGIPAFIVDPVVVDEMWDIARISGMPEIKRRSIFHALNQKAMARAAARDLGRSYEDVNLVVAHLGGGISVGAHRKGKVVDVNDALNGEGPFAPERAGGLIAWDVAKMAFSGEYTPDELRKKIAGKGGIVAYLGTNDMREVERRIAEGDKKAEMVYKAMAYQVAKEIGAMAAAMYGEVDAIVITGGLARDEQFVSWVKERVSFIAKVMIYPGEDEMRALALGALRVLKGEEQAREY